MSQKLSGRLEALISRGYPREDVIRLSSYSKEDVEYASMCAFFKENQGKTQVENPIAYYIGGQPGCGKTIMSKNIKNNNYNFIEVGIDNYRAYHPKYKEIEEYIKQFWKNRKETLNDSPGNDIADFTHQFAGEVNDLIVEKATQKNEKGLSYNVILEWGMRNPEEPLNSMQELKDKGYKNNVLFVCAHKKLSFAACILRADVMKDSDRIIRKVSHDFHETCIKSLPDSIDYIYAHGFENQIIDNMYLVLRNGSMIWSDKSQIKKPGFIFKDILNSEKYLKEYKNNSILASQISNNELNIPSIFEINDYYNDRNNLKAS